MTTSPVSLPWRRRLQFSIRVLIVVVLLIGGGLGWLVHGARTQREAVAAIVKAGGNVAYDWQWKNPGAIQGGTPKAPRWLIDILGVDYFGHVTVVMLPSASDDELSHLGRLGQLEYLVVLPSPGNMTTAGLAHLKRLSNLRHLFLGDTPLTDEGLTFLHGLTNLETLDLSSTLVTDAGLTHLEGLTRLSVLFLMNTQVTDAGLVHLKGLVNLKELLLLHTPVTDAGLVQLKGLTNLSVLDLQHTRVTDAGAQDLQRALPNLAIYR